MSSNDSRMQTAIAEQIHTVLAAYESERNKDGVRVLILIDPSLRNATADPEFDQDLKAVHKQDGVDGNEFSSCPPIRWQHTNLRPTHRPYLIPLELHRCVDAQLLQTSIRLALEDQDVTARQHKLGQRICSWLITTQPVQTLAEHLGRMSVQHLPTEYPMVGGKRTLLRYFDPNVLPALWEISDPAQRVRLFGPIEQWGVLDQQGELNFYSPDRDAAALAVPLSTSVHDIGYSTTQWMAIHDIGTLNEVATQWQLQNVSGLLPTVSQRDIARQALARSRVLGIEDEADRVAFAMHALTVHARFDSHPQVREALRTLQHNVYYTAAISSLTDDDWVTIRHDMNVQ